MHDYLPTLRLAFGGGVFNEYRLTKKREVEFRIGNGEWRALDSGEVELHYVLHTEVAKWLAKVLANADRTGNAPR
ncbi:MAG TPA: hypothetical protein VJT08_21820 [Terriglobales bacterium]|nr:hypothetical protein [Terriglobales bacterium]